MLPTIVSALSLYRALSWLCACKTRQQEISLEKGNDRIGQELLVMIEGKVSGESAYIARTYGDAPKVDGYIFVQTGELLMTGDFAKVRVTGALEYDLIGELADEYTE